LTNLITSVPEARDLVTSEFHRNSRVFITKQTVSLVWCSERAAYSEVNDYVFDKSYAVSCRTSTTRVICWKNLQEAFVK